MAAPVVLTAFLTAVAGINCDGTDQAVTWLDNLVPHKSNNCFNDKQARVDFPDSPLPDEEIDDEDETSNAPQILEAKCGSAAAEKQTHLTQHQ